MNFNELAIFKLDGGSHKSPEEGLCAMEAVAWLEGLPHSDSPECTCPVIAAYVRNINDSFPEQRQKLISYLPRLINTVSKEHEVKRAEYLAWQAIRVFAPLALEACGLNKEAKKLRGFSGSLSAAARAAHAAADAADAAADADAAAAAHTAAHTAARTARAARAAAHTADAARAAAHAVDAAHTARAAARAAFKTLDGVLQIGPKGMFSEVENVPHKIAAYRELVS